VTNLLIYALLAAFCRGLVARYVPSDPRLVGAYVNVGVNGCGLAQGLNVLCRAVHTQTGLSD
jgi:hypothetical protein